jgi:hypothetical protein
MRKALIFGVFLQNIPIVMNMITAQDLNKIFHWSLIFLLSGELKMTLSSELLLSKMGFAHGGTKVIEKKESQFSIFS